jgi:hypothetical protein
MVFSLLGRGDLGLIRACMTRDQSNNSGFDVVDTGLKFYVPDFEEDDAIVEAVYVELYRAL